MIGLSKNSSQYANAGGISSPSHSQPLSVSHIASTLTIYGIAHWLTDATCAALLFTIYSRHLLSGSVLFYAVIIYNLLAFGLQPLAGHITDCIRNPRGTALAGLALTGIAGLFFLSYPIPAVVLAGIGNALFHIGGGTVSLNLTPQKTTAPGIFVAPGDIGILTGTLIGKSGVYINPWLYFAVLVFVCILMRKVNEPVYDYKIKTGNCQYFKLTLVLILMAITIRSFVGIALAFPWKSHLDLLIILTVAVSLGKALGGVLGDRYGWMRIGVGGLLLSIPLLVLGTQIPALGILGFLLFNMTMSITLVVTSNLLPGRPGYSFGLTCMAIIIGALPGFFPFLKRWANEEIIVYVIILSAICLYAGLRLYSERKSPSISLLKET